MLLAGQALHQGCEGYMEMGLLQVSWDCILEGMVYHMEQHLWEMECIQMDWVLLHIQMVFLQYHRVLFHSGNNIQVRYLEI